MATEMTVAPAPAAAAFGATCAVTSAASAPSVSGMDAITTEVATALGLIAASDARAVVEATQFQAAVGQLGNSQVRSYVNTDDSNAHALSDQGITDC